MAGPREAGGTGIYAGGFPYKQVRIQSIHANTAATVDQFGMHINVSTLYRRGAGPYPRVGETWIIDRSLGFWTFASLVVGKPPVITGSTGGVPGLEVLLDALDDAGLVSNKTTDKTQATFDVQWHPVVLKPENNWLGFATYRRITGGLVMLRGTLRPAIPPQAGSDPPPATPVPSVAFTLPAKYRPATTLRLLGVAQSGAALQVQVDSNGNVTLFGQTTLDAVVFLSDGYP